MSQLLALLSCSGADGDSAPMGPSGDTGLLTYGWSGASTESIDGVLSTWFYYFMDADYLCVYDVTTTGSRALADCPDCEFAWWADYGEGSASHGECAESFGLIDGMTGEDIYGSSGIGVGFAHDATAPDSAATYTDVVLWQLGEGEPWYPVGYATWDGTLLQWTVYSGTTYYY
ncbi:MAG TPA: hypothetical protein QGF58_22390 [Myxococcota bacterium]|nr:hypothetical protein [Myxococcota bacterium]